MVEENTSAPSEEDRSLLLSVVTGVAILLGFISPIRLASWVWIVMQLLGDHRMTLCYILRKKKLDVLIEKRYVVTEKGKKKEKLDPLSFLYVEVWIFFLVIVQIFVLFSFSSEHWGKPWVAVYGLLDALGALLRDMVWSPACPGDHAIHIRDPRRWLMLAVFNIVLIVLSFANIYHFFHDDFCKPPSQAVTALYQSAITFSTLGYGDITPITHQGEVIVIAELAFFLLFLVVRLPLGIAAFTVKPSAR